MAGATGCDPFARSKSWPECGRAHLPIMDAGVGARQDLCRWTGGAQRRRRLSFPTRPPRLRSPAARWPIVLEHTRPAETRTASDLAVAREIAKQQIGEHLNDSL